MTKNSLSPGFFKLFYTSNGNLHVQTLPVKYDGIPTPGQSPNVLLQSGASQAAATAIGALVALLKPLHYTGSTFTRGEYWYQASATSSPVFIKSDDIVGGSGTSATTALPSGQAVVIFRTTAGGHLRFYVMEQSATTANACLYPPLFGGATTLQNLVNYIIGSTNFIVGRDGAYPTACVRWVTKYNDALRRKATLRWS